MVMVLLIGWLMSERFERSNLFAVVDADLIAHARSKRLQAFAT